MRMHHACERGGTASTDNKTKSRYPQLDTLSPDTRAHEHETYRLIETNIETMLDV